MSFQNSRAKSKLSEFTKAAASMHIPDIAGRSKFNFSYFTRQEPGVDFSDLDDVRLKHLLEKLKHFSRKPLLELRKERNALFIVYTNWPQNSSFTKPSHISERVHWARFRLGSTLRLVGFIVPDDIDGTKDENGVLYDRNTFYVVFVDPDHKFWPTEER